jgi:hypothetical protein
MIHYVVASDELSIVTTDHASARKTDEALGDVGYSESARDGLRSRTERLEDGRYATELSGTPVRGENDSLLASKVLVQAMNRRGADWLEPVIADAADSSIDCLAQSATSGRRVLIQVVRAISDSSLYRQLAQQTAYRAVATVETLIAHLAASVDFKEKALGKIERASLVLALDANRLPAFSMTEVRTAVTDQLPTIVAETGFKEVWLVGTIVEHTYRVWPAESDEMS